MTGYPLRPDKQATVISVGGGDMVGNVGTMEIKCLSQKTDNTQMGCNVSQRRMYKRKPMGITLLGGIMLVSGIFCVCAAFSKMPVRFIGLALSGWPAIMIHLLHAGISIYIFNGFLRLKRHAWSVYIIFLVLGVVNNLIAIISSGSFDPLAPITLMCLFGYYVYRKRQLFVN
ncbi:MAG TPA: hypothetical protein VMW78_02970 [Anaerolineae bacterium]|nr:hypothetical protein [Anaerolineae bacterium]